MKKTMQILYTAFEATPFFKSGGLGDVAGSLPGYISGTRYDIRVMLPKLNVIPERFLKRMEFMGSFEVPLSWRKQYCGLFKLRYKGLTYYFIDNEHYFHRNYPYGEFDDGERIAFFSKAILESLIHIPDFEPDIVHCNDWHTALVPVFLREFYRHIPKLSRIKTVFTVHNLKYQGMYSEFVLGDVLGLHNTPAAHQLMYGSSAVNYLQGALRYSDRLTTVSPSYAEEITTPYYGEGMNGIFRERRNILTGILNGIDNKKYDPASDKNLYYQFDIESLKNKTKNKLAFQKEYGLAEDAKIPLFCIISRLTEQKGMDLVNHILSRLVERNMQLVVLGIGDKKYEDAFKWYAAHYGDKVVALCTFDEPLSHKIYGCSDVLLMPSRFEPCGLSQMFAMRYATLPLVRETGGLKDSVMPYNKFTGQGTGFSFSNYNADELLGCIDAALEVWEKPNTWKKLQENAMTADFSWRVSANRYRALYRDMLG